MFAGCEFRRQFRPHSRSLRADILGFSAALLRSVRVRHRAGGLGRARREGRAIEGAVLAWHRADIPNHAVDENPVQVVPRPGTLFLVQAGTRTTKRFGAVV